MHPIPAIQLTIRIGIPADQDTWRRDDYRRLTPEQRLTLTVQMRDQAWPNATHIQHVCTIRRKPTP